MQSSSEMEILSNFKNQNKLITIFFFTFADNKEYYYNRKFFKIQISCIENEKN